MRLVVVLLGLLHVLTAGAQQIAVDADRDGDAVLVRASAQLKADPRLAWDVLTSYGDYARFVPDLSSSTVIARTGNTALVDQKGVAGFFLFRFPLQVRLAVTEEPYHRVRAQSVAGNFREMDGLYQLEPQGEVLLFTYSGRLVPDFALPPLIGTAAVRSAVKTQFTALVNEILRRESLKEGR